jgi:hypothetical protein
VLQDRADLSLERREIPFYSSPDFSQIDSEIVMNQDMAHLDNLGPRYLVMCSAERRGELAGCFADDLNVMNHPGVDQFVFLEDVLASLCIPFDTFNRVDYVLKALAIIPHKAIASFNTCFRIGGRSPRSEATSTGRLSNRSKSRMSAA